MKLEKKCIILIFKEIQITSYFIKLSISIIVCK